MMKEVKRPSVAISTVLRPTSFISGIASDAKTSSASMIYRRTDRLVFSDLNLNWYKIEESKRGIRYLEKADLDLRFQLVESVLHLFVAAQDS